MICEICHKEKATVFVTEIVDGVKTEKHMCSVCAAKEKTRMYSEDSFQQFLTGLLKLTGSEEKARKQVDECPNCHMTLDDFKKKSKFGCAMCYSVFEPYVKHILKSVHGSSLHTGKIPKRLGQKELAKETMEKLESDLKIALMEEDYIKAAKIRDELNIYKEGHDE